MACYPRLDQLPSCRTQGWYHLQVGALPHQLFIRKSPKDMPTVQSYGDNLSIEAPSSQETLVSVKLTKTNTVLGLQACAPTVSLRGAGD